MIEPTSTAAWKRLAGLGEDPADLATDLHPYLRRLGTAAPQAENAGQAWVELAARRLRTRSLTPGGLPQPPEVMGVDADARVPNALQPMPGELAGGQEVQGGDPGFHNPEQPPPTGVASGEDVPQGLLQQPEGTTDPVMDRRALRLREMILAPVGNERGGKPNLAGIRGNARSGSGLADLAALDALLLSGSGAS